jgi:hypothetical protein
MGIKRVAQPDPVIGLTPGLVCGEVSLEGGARSEGTVFKSQIVAVREALERAKPSDGGRDD